MCTHRQSCICACVHIGNRAYARLAMGRHRAKIAQAVFTSSIFFASGFHVLDFFRKWFSRPRFFSQVSTQRRTVRVMRTVRFVCTAVQSRSESKAPAVDVTRAIAAASTMHAAMETMIRIRRVGLMRPYRIRGPSRGSRPHQPREVSGVDP